MIHNKICILFLFLIVLIIFLLQKNREGYKTTPTTTLKATEPTKSALECYTHPKAIDYRGTVNKTKDGNVCLSWFKQIKSDGKIGFWTGDKDASKYGVGNHNFCRNPQSDKMGHESIAWCYTTDKNTRWGKCDVGESLGSCPTTPSPTTTPEPTKPGKCSFNVRGKTLFDCKIQCEKENNGRNCDKDSSTFCKDICEGCETAKCKWNIPKIEEIRKLLVPPLNIRTFAGDGMIKITWIKPFRNTESLERYYIVSITKNNLKSVINIATIKDNRELVDYYLTDLINNKGYKIFVVSKNNYGISDISNIDMVFPDETKVVDMDEAGKASYKTKSTDIIVKDENEINRVLYDLREKLYDSYFIGETGTFNINIV